jgi:hypothetical protein
MTTPTNDDEPSGAYPTPQQALEFMQKMWNPFGVPMPGFGMPGMPQSAPMGAPGGAAGMPGMPFPNPAMMFAALDPVEVERKIGELRVIENWLAMSLSMMQMSIKTLELQKASLEALRSAGSSPHGAGAEARRPRGGGK